jgi:DNA invertase Pin-like site-specific DNA recombinase
MPVEQGPRAFCGRLHLTRFARDKYDHFALRSHLQSLGISLRSAPEPIDDTSTGKLMECGLAAFAQFDNDVRPRAPHAIIADEALQTRRQNHSSDNALASRLVPHRRTQ